MLEFVPEITKYESDLCHDKVAMMSIIHALLRKSLKDAGISDVSLAIDIAPIKGGHPTDRAIIVLLDAEPEVYINSKTADFVACNAEGFDPDSFVTEVVSMASELIKRK